MKLKSLSILMTFFTILMVSAISFAQQGDQAEMMKKWQEYMTPGAAHQQFAKAAGSWKASVTTFMEGQEMKSEATGENKMVLGGRYLQSTFNGSMMGMPFEGMQLDAYDNFTKEYISVWIDNFGTGVLVQKGKKDEGTNEIVYTGTMIDPMSGGNATVKTVMKNIDDDHQKMTMYTVDGGKEIKNMEIEYTRVK